MDPVSVTASIIAILQLSQCVLSSCYRFVGKVNNATSDVDKIVCQVGHLTAILDDLKIVVHGESESDLPRISVLAGQQSPLVKCSECLKELDAKLSEAAGPMSFRRKLLWPFESKKVDEILDRIQKQMPILELALLGDDVMTTRAIMGSIEDSKRREERDKVLNWLCCVDPTVKHLASRRLHQPGSNRWILEADSFKEWKQTPGEVLWLYGIPGAGKTIICSTVIDHVEEICKSQPDSRVAYYYFDFSNQIVQNLGHVLRSIVWQLSKHEEYISNSLKTLYASCDHGRKEPDDEALSSTLFAILMGNPKSYIIIDALDECPLEVRVLFNEFVINRIQKQPGSYNFLFTSRKEMDIEQSMTELGQKIKLHEVLILAEDVNVDIRLHVRQFIANNRTLKDWSPQLRTEIEDTVSNGAQGMFRWAVCQLDLIKNCRQAGQVRKTLKNLPRTLDDTYDRILSSIPEETWRIARSALMLLTYSIRPLLLEELAEGMVIDYEEQKFDPDEHRLTNYRDVLEICSSLISVSTVKYSPFEVLWQADKARIEKEPSNTHEYIDVVQFAHFSVSEYMKLERASSSNKISRYSFSIDIAHRSISELSLIYLLDFSSGKRLRKIDFNGFPFLAYAAQFWPEHWRKQLDLKEQGTVNSLIRRILDSNSDQSSYINYLNICRPDSFLDKTYRVPFRSKSGKSLDSFPQPLYYAAQLGHYELCEWLIKERECDVNSRQGWYGQPIQIAARFGHAKVVRLLFDHRAEVNTMCGEYGYPLQAAAYGGHADVISILLDYEADPNAEGGIFGSALIAACHEGYLEVAKLLLLKGANMDIVCKDKGKALNIAASIGSIPLIRLLLQNGADINDKCDGEGSPLYAAALSGNLNMVKMLVTAGADVNLRSGNRCTALQAACSKKDDKSKNSFFLPIVDFLLKSGADPNIRGGEYGDALQAAVGGTVEDNVVDNNIDKVNLLLESGADINYKGGIYYSAMRATVSRGKVSAAHALIDRGAEVDDETFLISVNYKRLAVIPRLLEKGVNVNAQNRYGTVLQMAINNNDTVTIAALLQDPLIDINAFGGENGETALYCAVRAQNLETAKLLMQRGADINQPCCNGSYCLTSAIDTENMRMIELLLQHGADINASHIGDKTALISACERGNESLVRLLLNRGANVNLWVDRKGDALQHACLTGNEGIVKLLLQYGADVKAAEGYRGSCLECAIVARNFALTRLLIDAGANVNLSRSCRDSEKAYTHFEGPVLASIRYPQEGLLPLLIHYGADVNAFGPWGWSYPLQEAIQQDNEKAFRILLENGANVNQISSRNGSALVDAILKHQGNTCDKYLQLLLDAGADVNLQGEYLRSPLGAAVFKGNLSVVEKLLDLGADINAPVGRFGSALRIAVEEGDLEIFMLLLSRGADINAQGGYRGSAISAAAYGNNAILKELIQRGAIAALDESRALVSAADYGDNEAVSILLDHGVNLHCQQGVQGKALHVAAMRGHVSTVQLLLDRGADVNAFGGEYGNALMAALSIYYWLQLNKIGPTVNLLLGRGVNVNSPPSEKYTSALQAAIIECNDQFIDRLLDAGADVSAYDPRFGTALTAAATRGDTNLMEKLLDRGANLQLTHEKYGAPLQAAACHNRLEAVEFLLNHGVDVNQCSGTTGYALHAACCRDRTWPLVKLLLDHGANPNSRGGEYETALQAAALHGHLDIVKLLLRYGADPTIEGGRYGSPLKAALAKKQHYHVANFLTRLLQKPVPTTASLET